MSEESLSSKQNPFDESKVMQILGESEFEKLNSIIDFINNNCKTSYTLEMKMFVLYTVICNLLHKDSYFFTYLIPKIDELYEKKEELSDDEKSLYDKLTNELKEIYACSKDSTPKAVICKSSAIVIGYAFKQIGLKNLELGEIESRQEHGDIKINHWVIKGEKEGKRPLVFVSPLSDLMSAQSYMYESYAHIHFYESYKKGEYIR